MEILSLRSNAMLLPPIFYFSYFAMNIKATSSFLWLIASDTCILSEKLIKVLSSCTKSKINNHLIMVMGNFSCLFDSWAIVIIHSMYRKAESIHIKRITVCACTAICIPGHVHSLAGVDYHVLWSLSCGRIWLTLMKSSSPVKPPNFFGLGEWVWP